MDRAQLLKEAEAFFCKAMATDSYASGAEAASIEGMPDYKGYSYSEGDFKLIDVYTVNSESKKSAGFTNLWHRKRLIWWKAYGGFYEKAAIPCLKEALLNNYRRGVFAAGRGNDGYALDTYEYILRVEPGSSFENFSARESVLKVEQKPNVSLNPSDVTSMGSHFVWGMALI